MSNTQPKKNQYNPNIAIPPGYTLLESIQERNMSQAELAKRLNRPLKLVNEIIKGKSAITSETAIQLENVLGIPARFWNNLESQYQEIKARGRVENLLKAEVKEAKSYPYAEMSKWGWVDDTKDWLKRTENLLHYFGVTTLQNVIEKQSVEPIHCRISTKKRYSLPAIVAWLRKGVIESQNIEIKDYDETKFKELITFLRTCITKDVKIFQAEASIRFPACGIAFVVTPNLKNAPINGSTRWLSPTKALMQLSIRNKYSDVFWFTLFHECGHILLHGKRDLNIDFSNNGYVEEDKEKEADEYAKNLLIPSESYRGFVQRADYSFQAINKFAQAIEVIPGIVVGRLHHDKLIPMDKLNHLREKYEWIKA